MFLLAILLLVTVLALMDTLGSIVKRCVLMVTTVTIAPPDVIV